MKVCGDTSKHYASVNINSITILVHCKTAGNTVATNATKFIAHKQTPEL